MNLGTIDISLTSISSRIGTVQATLRSLLDQSYGDLRVHLFLSREPFLLDQGIHEIPQDLVELKHQSGDRLQIAFCRNIGPYRKLLPYLHARWGESRLVATADDDTIYPPNWLSDLARSHALHGCPVAYRGHRICLSDDGYASYRSWMKSIIEVNPGMLILPTGKDGVLYDTAFFPISVLNVDEALRLSPTADDLWFRWNLAMNGIPVFIMNSDYSDSFEETDYETSLYLNYNRAGNNDRAIARLEAHFRNRYRFRMSATEDVRSAGAGR